MMGDCRVFLVMRTYGSDLGRFLLFFFLAFWQA
jgi:hypothetical protein